MKELIKPFNSADSYEEEFAEAMCSENDCNCSGCSWFNDNVGDNKNIPMGEEDVILF